MTQRRDRFEVYKDKENAFRWRLVAVNGRIVADSGQSYPSKAGCKQGIRSLTRIIKIALIADLPSAAS